MTSFDFLSFSFVEEKVATTTLNPWKSSRILRIFIIFLHFLHFSFFFSFSISFLGCSGSDFFLASLASRFLVTFLFKKSCFLSRLGGTLFGPSFPFFSRLFFPFSFFSFNFSFFFFSQEKCIFFSFFLYFFQFFYCWR